MVIIAQNLVSRFHDHNNLYVFFWRNIYKDNKNEEMGGNAMII